MQVVLFNFKVFLIMPTSSPRTQSSKPIALVVGLIAVLSLMLSWSAAAQPCSDPATLPSLPSGPIAWESPVLPAPNLSWAGKTATSGYRILHFLHGLGGSSDSWNLLAARTAFQGSAGYPARQVVYLNPHHYWQNGNALASAMDIDAYLSSVGAAASAAQNIFVEDNILVGHSYGGVLSLLLDSLYQHRYVFDRQFGGIIAFGSAVNGAYMAKALHPSGDNLAVAFVEDACITLSNPRLWAPQFPAMRWIPGLDPLLRNAVDQTCGLGSSFVPFALKKFNSPGMVELFPNAPLAKRLGKRTPSVPVVLAYGVEDEPVFWRTATSMLATDSVGLALASNPFAMDADQELVTFASQQHDRHESQASDALQRAQNLRTWAWILSPTLVGALIAEWQAIQAEREAAAADKAASWYLDANNSYKQLIGARRMTLNANGFWCRCLDDPNNPSWFPVANASDCSGDDGCITIPRYEYALVEKPSDGVVLAESAGQLQGAVASIMMPGTNHQQMRNSSTTRLVLNRLMNGQVAGGAFFATPTR